MSSKRWKIKLIFPILASLFFYHSHANWQSNLSGVLWAVGAVLFCEDVIFGLKNKDKKGIFSNVTFLIISLLCVGAFVFKI